MVTERLRQGAMCDQGHQGPPKTTSNVARNAYRAIRRTGLSWKIPIEEYDYKKLDGSYLTTHYLRPMKIVEYLLDKKPLLVCGESDTEKVKGIFGAFWDAYRSYHGTHEVYQRHSGNLDRVVPLAIHGDEGKGKRRSSTTLVTLEAVIGCKGETRLCTECEPCGLYPEQWGPRGDDQHLVAKAMRTNMKGHSQELQAAHLRATGCCGSRFGKTVHHWSAGERRDLVWRRDWCQGRFEVAFQGCPVGPGV